MYAHLVMLNYNSDDAQPYNKLRNDSETLIMMMKKTRVDRKTVTFSSTTIIAIIFMCHEKLDAKN